MLFGNLWLCHHRKSAQLVSNGFILQLLITFEILLALVAPLLFLYLKGNWALRNTIPCLLSIPILWYLTYAPLHELSHIAGTYLVGGQVVDYKLIPRFWMGEFGRAWITPVGITHTWQQLIMTSSPYILDVACLVAGIYVLRQNFSRNPFVVGSVFMLLCLRPAFDFVCETIAFLSGDRGDFFHIEGIIGSFVMWSFLLLSIGLSLVSIVIVLRRFVGFPKDMAVGASR
jgi:hypothetical protein